MLRNDTNNIIWSEKKEEVVMLVYTLIFPPLPKPFIYFSIFAIFFHLLLRSNKYKRRCYRIFSFFFSYLSAATVCCNNKNIIIAWYEGRKGWGDVGEEWNEIFMITLIRKYNYDYMRSFGHFMTLLTNKLFFSPHIHTHTYMT